MRVLYVLILLSACAVSNATHQLPLHLVNEWETLTFTFPSPEVEQRVRKAGHYIPGASVPLDLHVDTLDDGGERIIMSIPRQGPGRPFTLAMLDTKTMTNGRPSLLPYPNFEWNDNQDDNNCTGLTSVFRIDGDDCGRIWVLDTGKIGNQLKCNPQIMAFDLQTGALLVRHFIPLSLTRDRTLTIMPLVDIQSYDNKCEDTFVYISDAQNFGLIVFDQKNNRSWRTENPLFYPFPSSATHVLAGQRFDLMGGVLAMALYPHQPKTPCKKLYFHAFASNIENVVDVSIIKNYTLWQNNLNAAPRAFQTLPGSRPTQVVTEIFDRWGRLYFGLYNPIALMRWSTDTPYNMQNFEVLAHNDKTLQFISGIKIYDGPGSMQKLWLLSCRYQKFMTGTYNFSEVNFRIFKANILPPAKMQYSKRNIAPKVNNIVTGSANAEEAMNYADFIG